MVAPLYAKAFRDALRMELAARGTDHKALRAIAATLIEKALAGDTTSANIVIERIDGKLPTPIAGDPEQPLTIRHIAWLGDQTIHEVKDVTGNGHSQAQIGPPTKVTIELPGQRKRDWARAHMRKKRAEAKAAKAVSVTSAIPDEVSSE